MKQYLQLLQELTTKGNKKNDRTGTGTISVFGKQFCHDLTTGFPLLTTKKIHFKSIINELIWFLSGNTNIRWLNDNGVNIWNEWADEDGNLGPIYGKQWTAWECKYGKHINQIDYVIDMLKNNPDSRRILFHGWNVEYLPDENLTPQQNVKNNKMALPPCHLLYQFYVNDNKLSSQLYIRSSDSFLGLPYNIASLALLTHMLAAQCNLTPQNIIVSIGDLHAYNNHLAQISLQLNRVPKKLPKLTINNNVSSIYDYKFSDFILDNYIADAHIPAKVSI